MTPARPLHPTRAGMNVAAAIAVASAVLSLGVGLLSSRISRAPGSGDQRWFSVVALASATYSFCNLGTTLAWPGPAVTWLSRVQVASIAVNLWAWLRFSHALLGRTQGDLERRASALLPGVALACLVPGVMFGDAVVDRPYAPLGVVYRLAEATASGDGLMVLLAGVALLLLVRLGRAWRAGATHAGPIAAAFALFLLFAVNDALATEGLDLPFLLDTGVAVPLLATGWVITERFVASARELDRLRRTLEAEVEARTRDLAGALDSLRESEKLAALGQFANGVAHEVNSPAAVVSASLRYLAESTADGRLPPDGPEALEDALAAMKQIGDLMRKLVDAGRIAEVPGGVSTVPVAGLLARAAADARARAGEWIAVVDAAPRELAVRARREALEQVLWILVSNAVEAIPRDRAGRLELSAARAGPVVRIAVRDDGAGMEPDVLRRAFDPFFTTKPAGAGAGLGLPVARGIVEANGGKHWLESAPGRGTTAWIELPGALEATPPPP